MKWKLIVTVAAALALWFLGCEGDYKRPSDFQNLRDLNRPDCRIGVWQDSDGERFSRKLFPNAAIVPFDEAEDAYVAMLGGQLEAFVADEHYLNVACRAYPLRFRMLDESLERHPAVALMSAKRPELKAAVDRFIAEFRRNGTYDSMFVRWCQSDRYVPMPTIAESTNATGVLRIGTSALYEPASFIDGDGNLVGYDVEFGRRLAAALNRRPEFVLRPDGDFYRNLLSGDVDIVIDNYDDSEIRKGLIASDGYLDADMKVLVADADPNLRAAADSAMLAQTRFGVADALIPNPRMRLIVNGFVNTVFIFLLAALLGALIVRRTPRRLARYLALLRWIPPVILLLLLHEAVVTFLPPYLVCVLALGLYFAALRLGEGQLPITRHLVTLLHWTCVTGALNVFDLAMAADLLCGRTQLSFVPMLGVALAYVALTWLAVRYGGRLEKIAR